MFALRFRANQHLRGILLGFLLLSGSRLFAQQNAATILGTVTDPSGAAIAGVKLTALGESTGFTRSAQSSGDGSFVIPLLPIGRYRLSAEAVGFKTFTRTGIELQLNQNARFTVALEVGAVTESIEVAASAPLVDTTSSAGGDVVERKRISELPLNGRNPLQLASLLPGVTVSRNPVALTAGNRNANFINVNGSRANETDYQLDGMRFAGAYSNSGLNYPSPDALEEFKLVTNAYGAEYGFYAGSIFTAVTRSGTNQIHGALWEFLRNDKLNARNFFAARVPILRQNQFGASAGFPILKNKLFGFVSYQGLRIRGIALASSFPPTADERRGVFASPVRDPRTNLPFPNNTIPADRISPVAAKLLNDFIPVGPSTGGGLLVTTGSLPINSNQWISKMDANLSPKDTLNVSYFNDRTFSSSPFASGPYPSYGARTENQVIPVFSVNYTRTFRPTLLNQLRVGKSGQREIRTCDQTLTARKLGINMDLEGAPQAPNFNVPGRFSIGAGGQCVWEEGGTNWQLADSLTWIRGRHQIKFGVDLYRRDFQLITGNADNGIFTFDGFASGNGIADFLLGELTSVTRRPYIDLGMRSMNSAFFVQDDIRISKRLTVNLGLRYELLGPFGEYRGVERSNVKIPQNANFRFGVQSQVIPSAPLGLLFTGDKAPDAPNGFSSAMTNVDRMQIQPRIGFAYDLLGNGTTSLRGSYGLYSNAHFGDMGAQSFQNQPFLLGQVLFRPAGGLSDPWQGIENPFPRSLDLTSNPNKKNFFLPGEGFGWDPTFVMPRVQVMTFGMQREFFKRMAIDAGYVGKLSRHLQDTINVNQADFIPGANPDGTAKSTLQNTDSRRRLVPNIYQKINMIKSIGNAAYHSFQFSGRIRAKNLTLMTAYTWSRSIDTGQSPSVQGLAHQDNFNPGLDRGLSDFHRSHVGRLSWVYDLPQLAHNRALALVAGGWQMSGITSLTTGAPFNVRTGRDNSLTAAGNDRPDLVGDPFLSRGRSRGEQIAQFFNTNAFAPNAIGRFGNLGRNTMYGPRFANSDVAVMKNFTISERFRLQFRSEFYNVFNQVNFDLPNSTVTATPFGRLASAQAPRVIQFALKLSY